MRPPYFTYNSEVKADELKWSLGKLKNVEEVFGYNKLQWLFPVYTSVGEGRTFPKQIIIPNASSYDSNKEYSNKDYSIDSPFQTNLDVTPTNGSETDNTYVVNMTSETKNNDDNSYLSSSVLD